MINFLIYPIMLILMVFAFSGQENSPGIRVLLVSILSTMFTGLTPIITVSGIIGEDKRTNTLRMLIMSTVKPLEYLIGITTFILSCFLYCPYYPTRRTGFMLNLKSRRQRTA